SRAILTAGCKGVSGSGHSGKSQDSRGPRAQTAAALHRAAGASEPPAGEGLHSRFRCYSRGARRGGSYDQEYGPVDRVCPSGAAPHIGEAFPELSGRSHCLFTGSGTRTGGRIRHTTWRANHPPHFGSPGNSRLSAAPDKTSWESGNSGGGHFGIWFAVLFQANGRADHPEPPLYLTQ